MVWSLHRCQHIYPLRLLKREYPQLITALATKQDARTLLAIELTEWDGKKEDAAPGCIDYDFFERDRQDSYGRYGKLIARANEAALRVKEFHNRAVLAERQKTEKHVFPHQKVYQGFGTKEKYSEVMDIIRGCVKEQAQTSTPPRPSRSRD